MATSRRLIFASTFLRIHRTSSTTTRSSLSQSLPKSYSTRPKLQSLPLFNRLSPSSPNPHLFQRYNNCSSSSSATLTTIDDVETTSSLPPAAAAAASHPWPEWVTFIDHLKSKGYYNESLDTVADGDVVDDGEYTDLHKAKAACLDFARKRFDIFKSLSREDIQTVVGIGCPSLLRKAVNSAKRLRVFVRLDEGDVCSACNLRGSCDRAYGILKENEDAARTVDVVRILLIYALDPLVLSGGEKPHGREQIEVSLRKLLLEMIKLSEKDPDPALPKPVLKLATQKVRDEPSQSVEMKRGDWFCSKCDFVNFARNIRCLKCNEDRQNNPVDDLEMKKGDWNCPKCSFMNFARNIRCLQCREEGPKRVSTGDIEMKKGDWNCPKCDFMNFARNTKCLRCQGSRPPRELNPGEWECPSCDFLNYRRNMACLKCNCERPKDEVAQYEDQIWRSP